jgi:hypothetical protein
MLRRVFGAAVVLTVVLLAGCRPAAPTIVTVEGDVLLDGAPLPKAKVRFSPRIEQSSEYIAEGVTDDKGHFILNCHGQPGACVGENLVTVTEDEIPEHLTPENARSQLQAYLKSLKNRPIPEVYGNAAQSPLTVTVTADRKEYKIELKR